MIKSALLSIAIGNFCMPIEAKRTYLYTFYPEQANLCYRVSGTLLGGSEVDLKIRQIEKNTESAIMNAVQATIHPYIYAPLMFSGDILLKKKITIPIFKNETFLWIGDNSMGLALNFVF